MFCDELAAMCLLRTAKVSFLLSTAPGNDEPLPLSAAFFVIHSSASYFSLLLSNIRLQSPILFRCR